MLLKILLAVGVIVLLFLGFVATRDGHFHYQRSGVIKASAEQIFPYLSTFSKCSEWSPYEKDVVNLKRNFTGPDGQVGSTMSFDDEKSGAGVLTFTKIEANHLVELNLDMSKPFKASHSIQYRLNPVNGGTEFTYTMFGDGGFLSKLMAVLIDCEKLIGDKQSEGVANLKALIEKEK